MRHSLVMANLYPGLVGTKFTVLDYILLTGGKFLIIALACIAVGGIIYLTYKWVQGMFARAYARKAARRAHREALVAQQVLNQSGRMTGTEKLVIAGAVGVELGCWALVAAFTGPLGCLIYGCTNMIRAQLKDRK